MWGGYPSFNLFIYLAIPSILPITCPPSPPSIYPSTLCLFNHPFIYPPTHHSIHLPTIFFIFHSSIYPLISPIYSIIHLSSHPLSILPSLLQQMLSTVSMARSGLGVGRDSEQWKECSSTCNADIPAGGRKGEHQVPRVEHSVPKAVETQGKFLRRVVSGVICILASAFQWKVGGDGQGGGARLPETDRVIWQTARAGRQPAGWEGTGRGHGSSLYKRWGLPQVPGQTRRGT